MASSWRDYRAQKPVADGVDVSDNRDVSPGDAPDFIPNVPNVTNVTALPVDVRRGLTFLANAPAPRGSLPERWPVAVNDAARLASDGWALKALALGWSELDLFGVGTNGNPYTDGLAAWLAGRKLLAIAESWAVALDEAGNRHFWNRPRAQGAVLLWKVGGRG